MYIVETEGMAAATAKFNVALWENVKALLAQAAAWLKTPVGMWTVGAVAILGLLKAFDYVNDKPERLAKQLADVNSQIAELTSQGGEYATLKANIGNLTAAEKERLAVLQAQLDTLREQQRVAAQASLDDWRQKKGYVEYGEQGATVYGNVGLGNKYANELDALNQEFADGTIVESEYRAAAAELVTGLSEVTSILSSAADAGV